MSNSPEIELLHRAWEAMSGGDFAVLEEALATEAKWHKVYEGPMNCEGASTIIEVMSRNLQGRLRGRIEDTIQTGPRVIVAFRPEQPSDAESRSPSWTMPMIASTESNACRRSRQTS